MKNIVLLNEELGSQMQIYLALCDAYNVEIAEDLETAMYLLRKMRPEMLVLDYNLTQFKTNGKTGSDFAKKVKKKYADLKIMMILEICDKPQENEVQTNGADSILYKPFENKKLLSNVRKLTKTASLNPAL